MAKTENSVLLRSLVRKVEESGLLEDDKDALKVLQYLLEMGARTPNIYMSEVLISRNLEMGFTPTKEAIGRLEAKGYVIKGRSDGRNYFAIGSDTIIIDVEAVRTGEGKGKAKAKAKAKADAKANAQDNARGGEGANGEDTSSFSFDGATLMRGDLSSFIKDLSDEEDAEDGDAGTGSGESKDGASGSKKQGGKRRVGVADEEMIRRMEAERAALRMSKQDGANRKSDNTRADIDYAETNPERRKEEIAASIVNDAQTGSDASPRGDNFANTVQNALSDLLRAGDESSKDIVVDHRKRVEEERAYQESLSRIAEEALASRAETETHEAAASASTDANPAPGGEDGKPAKSEGAGEAVANQGVGEVNLEEVERENLRKKEQLEKLEALKRQSDAKREEMRKAEEAKREAQEAKAREYAERKAREEAEKAKDEARQKAEAEAKKAEEERLKKERELEEAKAAEERRKESIKRQEEARLAEEKRREEEAARMEALKEEARRQKEEMEKKRLAEMEKSREAKQRKKELQASLMEDVQETLANGADGKSPERKGPSFDKAMKSVEEKKKRKEKERREPIATAPLTADERASASGRGPMMPSPRKDRRKLINAIVMVVGFILVVIILLKIIFAIGGD